MRINPGPHIAQRLLLFLLLVLPAAGFAVSDPLQALGYYDQGTTFLEEGEIDSAVHYLELAEPLYWEMDSVEAYVYTILAHAYAHFAVGDLAESATVLEKAHDKVEQSPLAKPEDLATLYDLMVPVYESQGDLDRALKIAIKSLDLDLEEEDIGERAYRLNNIGVIYLSKGDFRQAGDYYMAAAEHFSRADDLGSRASSLVNLGLVQMRMEQHETARKTLENALDLIGERRSPELDRTAVIGRNHLALCNIELEFPLLAKLELKLNLIKYDLEPGDEALVRANLGFAHSQLKEYGPAVEELEKGIALAQEHLNAHEIATMELHLAVAVQQLEGAKASFPHFTKGIELLAADAGLSPDSLQNVSSDGNPDAIRVRDKRTLFRLLAGRGRLALLDESLPETASYDPVRDFQDAFFIMDLMRADLITPDAKKFLATYVRRLNDDAMALFAKTYPGNTGGLGFGYEVLERRKALLLLENVVSNWQGSLSQGTRDQLERSRQIESNLTLYERSLYEADQNGDQAGAEKFRGYVLELREELRQLNEATSGQAGIRDFQQEFMSLERVEAYAKENDVFVVAYGLSDTLLLTMCIGPNRSVVDLEQGSEVKSIRIRAKMYAQSLSDWQAALNGDQEDLESFASTSTFLYRKLLGVVRDEGLSAFGAKGNEKHLPLVIIPDGILNFIPFETFVTHRSSDREGYSMLPYLIRERAVSYAYSGTLLVGMHEERGQERPEEVKCLAFAPGEGSNEGEESLSALRDGEADLPGARREVRALAESFDGAYFVGRNARKQSFVDSVRNKDFGVIHLAMHGIVNDEHSQFSYLAFEGAMETDPDSRLNDYEIRQMDLTHAQMVVLSACETGLGTYVDGEGVLSMGRSFVQAGAESVVMSLWKLEDGASAELMESFYRHLKEGLSRRAALRQAKLDYLDQADDLHAHPSFWAGYVLVGETGALVTSGSGLSWFWYAGGGLVVLLLVFLGLRKRQKSRKARS